jgi:LPLT family lysophospholipid transporter-like MFS transporter
MLLPLAVTTQLAVAVPLLIAVGLVGGLLVVPLNALLQHRGCRLLSAGRSIAVQGFNENASVLVMLAGYSLCVALDVPIVLLLGWFGVAVAAAMGLLLGRARRAATGGSSADSLAKWGQHVVGRQVGVMDDATKRGFKARHDGVPAE